MSRLLNSHPIQLSPDLPSCIRDSKRRNCLHTQSTQPQTRNTWNGMGTEQLLEWYGPRSNGVGIKSTSLALCKAGHCTPCIWNSQCSQFPEKLSREYPVPEVKTAIKNGGIAVITYHDGEEDWTKADDEQKRYNHDKREDTTNPPVLPPADGHVDFNVTIPTRDTGTMQYEIISLWLVMHSHFKPCDYTIPLIYINSIDLIH